MASVLNNGVSDAADYVPSSESTTTPIPAVVTAESSAKAASLLAPKPIAINIEDVAPSSNSLPIGISGGAVGASSSNAGRLKLPIGPVGQAAAVYTPFPQLAQNGGDAIKALICRAWDAKNLSGKYLGTEYIISDEHLHNAYAPFIKRFQLLLTDVWKCDFTVGRPKLAEWWKNPLKESNREKEKYRKYSQDSFF